MPLTEEQQRTAEDNIRLVYKFYGQYRRKNLKIPDEDLLQVAFVGYLKAVEAHNPTISKLCTAAFTYMRNEVINYVRCGQGFTRPRADWTPRYADAEFYGDFIAGPNSVEVAHDEEHRTLALERLQPAMESLLPHLCETVRLRYFERMTLREIGETLGISKEAVRQRIITAVKHLKKSSHLRELAYV